MNALFYYGFCIIILVKPVKIKTGPLICCSESSIFSVQMNVKNHRILTGADTGKPKNDTDRTLNDFRVFMIDFATTAGAIWPPPIL